MRATLMKRISYQLPEHLVPAAARSKPCTR
jgi:hypothetical protein